MNAAGGAPRSTWRCPRADSVGCECARDDEARSECWWWQTYGDDAPAPSAESGRYTFERLQAATLAAFSAFSGMGETPSLADARQFAGVADCFPFDPACGEDVAPCVGNPSWLEAADPETRQVIEEAPVTLAELLRELLVDPINDDHHYSPDAYHYYVVPGDELGTSLVGECASPVHPVERVQGRVPDSQLPLQRGVPVPRHDVERGVRVAGSGGGLLAGHPRGDGLSPLPGRRMESLEHGRGMRGVS